MLELLYGRGPLPPARPLLLIFFSKDISNIYANFLNITQSLSMIGVLVLFNNFSNIYAFHDNINSMLYYVSVFFIVVQTLRLCFFGNKENRPSYHAGSTSAMFMGN